MPNRVPRPTRAILLAALCGACHWADGPIRHVGADPVVHGALSLTPIRFSQTEYSWFPTPGKLLPGPLVIDAEEGELRVPVRHEIPDGDSLTIHFVRFRSTAAHPGPPIVYLAGGPGGSGVLSAAGDRWPVFQALRAAGDVIALDQRGVYGSAPYPVCAGDWSQPLDRPTDVAELEQSMDTFLDTCYRHWSDSVDLKAFNTVESAADLDALRAALGADKVVLWGISYGTHLALAYLRQFPDHAAAAILAGTEGPDQTWKLPGSLDAVLVRIDSAMHADPRFRAMLPDFLGSVRSKLAELDRSPAEVRYVDPRSHDSGTVVIGGDDLRRGLLSELVERKDIERLPAKLMPVLRGDLAAIAPLFAQGRRGHRELAMAIAMDCSSGVSPERLARIDAQASTAILRDAGNMTLRAQCARWPVDPLGEAFRSPVRSNVPVLFISGTLDLRTPLDNAEEVRRGFPNSHLLVIDGGGHDDDLVLSSPVIQETMLQFLRGDASLVERIALPPLKLELP